MGSSRWEPDEFDAYTADISTKSIDKVYTTDRSSASKVLKDFLPTNFKYRESCDSSPNPNSTPIIVGIDITGSMGRLADVIVREGLGTLVEEIYKRKPVPDPHVLLMAIGDAECGDQYPVQATQFEADMRLVEQLTKFYLEKGGGGNYGESYNLAWYFAATRTKCDSFSKRKRKGYLFTVGDEAPLPGLTSSEIRQFFGDTDVNDMDNRELLTAASKEWEVYHLIVDEPSHRFHHSGEGERMWNDLLGQRAMRLTDHTQLAEVIVSAIQVNEGADKDAVVGSWSGTTALAVSNAINGLTKSENKGTGVRRI